MISTRQTAGKLLFRIFLFFWAALLVPVPAKAYTPPPPPVSTVAGICNQAGNTCAGGVVTIKTRTIVTCLPGGTTLDFETETIPALDPGPFPNVVVDANGVLTTDGASACDMTFKVGTLVVKRLGQILHPVLNQGMKPGKIAITASAPTLAVGGPTPVGGAIDLQADGRLSVLGGPTGLDPEPISPTIELTAVGDITINQYIFASAITTGAVGGHILIESTEGKVIVGRRGYVDTNNGRSNFGGTLVDIAACKGIEIYGVVDGSIRMLDGGVHLFSNGYITIDGARVASNRNYGDAVSWGDNPPVPIVIEAMGNIAIKGSVVTADGARGNGEGGDISIHSTGGKVDCIASKIESVGIYKGGTIGLQSSGDLTYNCVISALASPTYGTGGDILLQSFGGDVTAGTALYSKVTVIAKTSGTITLKGHANPLTAGGNFVPAGAVLKFPGLNETDPVDIPACP